MKKHKKLHTIFFTVLFAALLYPIKTVSEHDNTCKKEYKAVLYNMLFERKTEDNKETKNFRLKIFPFNYIN